MWFSKKWELGNEIEAVKAYLVVKINFKEQYYVPSEYLVIEEEEGKRKLWGFQTFLSPFWKRLGKKYNANMNFKCMLYNNDIWKNKISNY